jgi:hypothetical protein
VFNGCIIIIITIIAIEGLKTYELWRTICPINPKLVLLVAVIVKQRERIQPQQQAL